MYLTLAVISSSSDKRAEDYEIIWHTGRGSFMTIIIILFPGMPIRALLNPCLHSADWNSYRQARRIQPHETRNSIQAMLGQAKSCELFSIKRITILRK